MTAAHRHFLPDLQIVPASDDEKAAICTEMLRGLPDWFGIPEAIDAYVAEVPALPMLVARDGGRTVGFVSLRRHAPAAWELHLIAVAPDRHRQGVGRRLLAAAEAMVQAEGATYLSVKTLSAANPDPGYAATRRFYEAMGFVPLMELPTLWSPENPCLVMVKRLG